MLRLSVIIPTCDRPLLLERALRSVAAQETPPVEVIVVDDGTSDHAVPAESDGRPLGLEGLRIHPNQRRRGPSGARNTGAELATGDLLAFLDDDDEWAPTYLREVLRHCAAAAAEMLCTDLMLRFEDGTERPGKRVLDELMASEFLTRNPGLIGSNLVLRRSLYRAAGGFDESLPAAEDMDLGIRISLLGGVRYAPVHQPLVYHHQHQALRLCMRRGAAIRAGITRFYQLHQHRMSEEQRKQYRRMAIRYWGVDEHGRDVG